MTRRDAFQIARQADQTGELQPTHQLAADLRFACVRSFLFDAFELTGLGIFVAAIALMAKWAGA